MPQRIIILCTGNSCRSQMAQVIWQQLVGDRAQVESAGSAPSGYVHPLAIKALQELKLPTDGLQSKSIEPFINQKIDLVVSVCDHAQQNCPVLPHVQQQLHWPFDDPAEATGSEEEKMLVFRRVRDEIKQRISEYVQAELRLPS